MSIIKEIIDGHKIINEISSSNIKKTIYDTQEKKLYVTFNNGTVYMYLNVPHQIYTRFRLSKSQGQFFSMEISKKYEHKKIS